MPKSSKVLKAPKSSPTSKALVKATKRASKQLDKKIKKLNKSITKAVRKKSKEKESILAKRRKKIQRLAERAELLNEQYAAIANQYKREGYTVDDSQVKITSERISKIYNKQRPTEKDVELLKDYTKKSHYDYIKIEMPVRTEEFDGIETVIDEEVSLKEIERIRKKQVENPYKLTDREEKILTEYAKAMITTQNQETIDIPDLDTLSDEEAENVINKFKDKFKRNRDISIGGNSTLINDLSYTYNALSAGRDFVIMLQRMMNNPEVFIKIEAWYRTALDVKQKIDSAIGKQWYDNFLQFSDAITEAIQDMPSLPKEAESMLSDFMSRMEIMSDEEAFTVF